MEELEEENPQVLFQKAECSKEIGEALTNYKGGIRIILKKLLSKLCWSILIYVAITGFHPVLVGEKGGGGNKYQFYSHTSMQE